MRKPYWSEQAIDCYNIGCICSKCLVNEVLNGNCKMKKTVLKLVKTLGKPPETKEDRLNIEEIKDLLREGLTTLEIAKRYQIDQIKFREFTHAHGLFALEINRIRKEGKKCEQNKKLKQE